jgi:hypothetical protein
MDQFQALVVSDSGAGVWGSPDILASTEFSIISLSSPEDFLLLPSKLARVYQRGFRCMGEMAGNKHFTSVCMVRCEDVEPLIEDRYIPKCSERGQ